jgi:alanine racemase
VEALITAVRSSGRSVPLGAHVKVDTGMHRVGAAPADAVALAVDVDHCPELDLQGFWTHLAVADEVDDPYTAQQLRSFDDAVAALAAAGVRPRLLHAANSAGTLWHPAARYAMVRCGIALYGLAPGLPATGALPIAGLRPAMALKARVSHVKRLGPGERMSYGLRYRLEQESVIATVPLGYADGVTRSLSARGGEVLIGGHRCPIAGTVTMDQILVDCGPGSPVAPGDEAVLLGPQGSDVVTAWEWASRTGTIAYEVVCGVSGRVPRTYRRG